MLLVAAPASATPLRRDTTPNESGVVDIETSLAYEQAAAYGTGEVLTPSGEVLTNNHVIRGATTIRVVEPNSGRSYAATVVGYDVGTDVAVLQMKGAAGLATVTAGNSATLAVRDPVTAVGNAGGVGGAPSVTTGKVLALHQAITVGDDSGGSERLRGVIETSASLQPGDSGGPLLNATGQVIGMNTAASGGFQFEPGTSQGFAIPIDQALAIATQIESRRASAGVHLGATAFIGITVSAPGDGPGFTLPGSTNGALVVGVVPSSPAARAGMSYGDLITSLAGHRIVSPAAVTGVVLGLNPGAAVTVTWTDQSGSSHSVGLHLASGPPQ